MSTPLYVIFDGGPGPVAGRFVEVEDAQGRGRKLGEWKQNRDGTWSLGPFYSEADMDAAQVFGEPLPDAIQRRCWTLTDAPADGLGQCWLYNGHPGEHQWGEAAV